jgi:hypothetical protein
VVRTSGRDSNELWGLGTSSRVRWLLSMKGMRPFRASSSSAACRVAPFKLKSSSNVTSRAPYQNQGGFRTDRMSLSRRIDD